MRASLSVPSALLPLAGWLALTVQAEVQFERISVSGLGGANGAWVDVDNDGDLDVVFAGGTGVAVYRNDGTGHFAAREIIPANDGRAFTPSVQWLDYNRDGWMDVLLNGPRDANTRAVPRAAILVSQQGISFTAVTAPNGYSELGAAGDADGDGDADLITDISGFYRQDGPAGLVKPTEPSDARSYAYGPLWPHSVRWLDLDGDGDLDVIRGTSRPFASINALPTGFIITEFFGITNSQVSPTSGFPSLFWSDANLDGLPDYFWSRLLAAGGSYMSTGEVCTGSGNAAFTPVTIPGAGIARAMAAWGDVDGDGDEDLFVSGWTADETTPLAGMWLNNRAEGWSQTPLPPKFDGRPGGIASWGDADQDGRVDLLVSNSSGTEVWRNISTSSNLPPATAVGLSATAQADGQVLLAWDPPAGDETPAVSLTWNLRVGTVPGAGDIVSPCADTASGRRRLTGPGNQTWGPPRARLRLPSGTYYWSVQAVDAGYAGGPFSAEQSFTVVGVPLVHTGLTSDEKGTSLKLHGTLHPMGVERSYSFEWGTTPALGRETPLRTLAALSRNNAVGEVILAH